MGKEKNKTRKKCCAKYLEKGKYCKNCPLLKQEGGETIGKTTKKKKDKEKKGGKKK